MRSFSSYPPKNLFDTPITIIDIQKCHVVFERQLKRALKKLNFPQEKQHKMRVYFEKHRKTLYNREKIYYHRTKLPEGLRSARQKFCEKNFQNLKKIIDKVFGLW